MARRTFRKVPRNRMAHDVAVLLQTLNSKFGKHILDLTLQFWTKLWKKYTPAVIKRMIETGEFAIDSREFVNFVSAEIAPIWAQSSNQGMVVGASNFGALSEIATNTFNREMTTWMSSREGFLGRGMAEQHMSAVRSAVTYFHKEESLSYEQIANEIQHVVGLTERQVTALNRRRAELLESGMKPKDVGFVIKRQREKMERDRALRIARTEVNAATNQGIIEAASAKAITENKIAYKRIEAYPDCCDVCRRIEESQPERGIPLTGGFDYSERFSGDPPFHPNCRCVIVIEFV